jgi:hypothetical protein
LGFVSRNKLCSIAPSTLKKGEKEQIATFQGIVKRELCMVMSAGSQTVPKLFDETFIDGLDVMHGQAKEFNHIESSFTRLKRSKSDENHPKPT